MAVPLAELVDDLGQVLEVERRAPGFAQVLEPSTVTPGSRIRDAAAVGQAEAETGVGEGAAGVERRLHLRPERGSARPSPAAR